MAPGANQVPRLMADLFEWLKHSDAPALIKSCVFHYEFEFIHPFADGNGRMGRLWQRLILSQWQPLFIDIPVESLIYQHQESYYHALRASTAKSDSAPFIEFMLGVIVQTLQEVYPSSDEGLTASQLKMRVEMKVKTPQRILALLAKNPAMTLDEVAQHLGKSPSTIERAVAQLKQQQKLIYHGPKKGGYWQVLEG